MKVCRIEIVADRKVLRATAQVDIPGVGFFELYDILRPATITQVKAEVIERVEVLLKGAK